LQSSERDIFESHYR